MHTYNRKRTDGMTAVGTCPLVDSDRSCYLKQLLYIFPPLFPQSTFTVNDNIITVNNLIGNHSFGEKVDWRFDYLA